MADGRPCPSDLSDARWELIEPVLAAWRYERHGRALAFGRPAELDLREIMNAILYVDRTGVQWRYLPHDFPHWNSVYGYFAKWQKDGIFAQLNGLLRELVREQEGRDTEPSACVIDAQSVKTSTSVPAASQGTDNAKKIVGRKRSIVTDGSYTLSSPLKITPPYDQLAVQRGRVRQLHGPGHDLLKCQPHLGAAPGAQHQLARIDGNQCPESVPLGLCAVELSTAIGQRPVDHRVAGALHPARPRVAEGSESIHTGVQCAVRRSGSAAG
jgi:transposase